MFKKIFPRSGNNAKRCVEFRHLTFKRQELGGKWETECLITRFQGYSVNLKDV